MSASDAASAAVTGLPAAVAGAGAGAAERLRHRTAGLPATCRVLRPGGCGGRVGDARVRVQHQLGRDRGALGHGARHDGGGQRGKEHLALADHGGGVFGAFGLARDRAKEGGGSQRWCLDGDAQRGRGGFELRLADAVPGVDEGRVAGVRKGIAQCHGPQRGRGVALGVLEGAAVHGKGWRAVDRGVRGHAVAEHGQGIDHLEDRAGGVLAQHCGVVAVAAGSGGGREDGAAGGPERHDGRRRADLGRGRPRPAAAASDPGWSSAGFRP